MTSPGHTRNQAVRKKPRLPSKVFSSTDPRYEAAQRGDNVLIGARRWRKLSLPIAATVYMSAANVGFSFLGKSAFAFAILPAMAVFVSLRTRYVAPPWTLDYRPPILVLRSHLDERIKHGEELPTSDMDPRPPEPNQYVWQLALALWDWSRVVLLLEENPTFALPVKAIVVKTNDKGKSWLLRVEKIARDSWVILVFPSSTPGCIDELRLLANNSDLLRKTVVFMPPTASGLDALFAQMETPFRDRWVELSQELVQSGFQLPDYDPRGLFYLPKYDFSIETMVPLDHKAGPWSLMAELVPHPEVGNGHLRDVIGYDYAYEADDPTKRNGGRGLWWRPSH